MATAQSYEANLPSTSVPNANGYGVSWSSSDMPTTGQSWFSKFIRGLTGIDEEQQYKNLMTENNRAYEQALLREQRAYDDYVRKYDAEREDTKYQRLRKDLEAAGINPLYALQGGLSGASAQTSVRGEASNISGGSSAKSKDNSNSSGIAGLLISIAKLLG